MKGRTVMQSFLDKKDIEWPWKTVTGEATGTIYIIHAAVMCEPFGKKRQAGSGGERGEVEVRNH